MCSEQSEVSISEGVEVGEPLDLTKEEKLFHAQPRFSIVYLLFLKRRIGFIQLQQLLNLTPGNLDHHLKKLEEGGIISTRRVISWKPLVMVQITPQGIIAVRNYILRLRNLLEHIPDRLLNDE